MMRGHEGRRRAPRPITGPAAWDSHHELVERDDDALAHEVDVEAVARRRVAALEGPGADSPEAQAAYWRELSQWEGWGEWAPSIEPVDPERLEELRNRGWLR